MADKPHYKVEQFLDAIRGTGPHDGKGSSGGLKRIVALRLGCHRDTVANYTKRYPTIQKALDSEDEGMLDRSEAGLHAAIASGNLTAIIFHLKTKGKARGYVERVQVEEYVEQEMEAVRAALEEGLEPHEFRKVTGVLARLSSG